MHTFTRSSIFMFSYRFAEATCRSTIRSARGVIEDIGVETAKKSSGLLNIARCSEKKIRKGFSSSVGFLWAGPANPNDRSEREHNRN